MISKLRRVPVGVPTQKTLDPKSAGSGEPQTAPDPQTLTRLQEWCADGRDAPPTPPVALGTMTSRQGHEEDEVIARHLRAMRVVG